jgi:hypothetical protein
MWILVTLIFLVLAVLSLRGVRWAYITFIVLGLLSFPTRVSFRLDPQPCELAFNIPLALFSLTNYGHIWRLALFFVMTSAQLRMNKWSAFALAALTSIGMGVLVELAEGITGKGHCRVRDLVPDTAGIILGAVIVLVWNALRKRSHPS